MSTTYSWPSPADYSAAIQNPQNCFGDAELRAGSPRTNKLGLPLGMSGNYAVVYQLQSRNGNFAVRCFIRPVVDQQQRYEALSQHLAGLWLPALTGFTYLPQGIRVRGQWYPIVRMEWVDGKQMHRYVEDHLRQNQALAQLAAQWRGVVAGLSGAHLAHGDLQHGNILIQGQSIRLVDYDGFFIPALRTRPPDEVGHPSYQHPERIEKGYYRENSDAFSALVIYLSLLALQSDPGLWTFHNGENLVFLANDFKNPGHTPIWGQLQANPDAHVRRLTETLEGFCRKPVSGIPDLEEVLQHLPPAQSASPRQPAPLLISTQPSPFGGAGLRPMGSPVLPKQPSIPTGPPRPSGTGTSTVTCPNCGFANAATEFYCQRCTHELRSTQPCPSCGHSVPSGVAYCADCGHSVTARTINCPNCNRPNAANEIFCQTCMAPLSTSRACGYCGQSIPQNTRYCPNCGHKV